MKQPVDHIVRPMLPWRSGAGITECGYDASKVSSLSRDAYVQRVKDIGKQRAFLKHARAPAHGARASERPPLFACLTKDQTGRAFEGHGKDGPVMREVPMPAGTRVRVVMASRFGDVGVTPNLDQINGYLLRLSVNDLDDFGAGP